MSKLVILITMLSLIIIQIFGNFALNQYFKLGNDEYHEYAIKILYFSNIIVIGYLLLNLFEY